MRREVLIVLAVIVILAARLIPAISRSREIARKTRCRNNLKAIGLGLHNYLNSYRSFPAGWIGADDGQPQVFGLNGFGWGPGLIPYLEANPVYNLSNFRAALGDASNDRYREALRGNMQHVFRCPNDTGEPVWTTTWKGRSVVMPTGNYVGVFGTDGLNRCAEHPNRQCVGDGAFYHNSFLQLSDFKEGTSNTCMVGERRSVTGDSRPWCSTWVGVVPGDDRALYRLLGTGEHVPGNSDSTIADFSSHHSNGAFFLLADGSVKFLSTETDLPAFRNLLSTGSTKDAIVSD
jgi:type II secretory pathway pseudopilin PulG